MGFLVFMKTSTREGKFQVFMKTSTRKGKFQGRKIPSRVALAPRGFAVYTIHPMGPQRIVVVQQRGSGEAKIEALRMRGRDLELSKIIDITVPLPTVIDDPSEFLPATIEADLVLSFVKHPDLALDLARMCSRLGIPVVASGKKLFPSIEGVLTPPT